jgi:hypothetical protein
VDIIELEAEIELLLGIKVQIIETKDGVFHVVILDRNDSDWNTGLAQFLIDEALAGCNDNSTSLCLLLYRTSSARILRKLPPSSSSEQAISVANGSQGINILVSAVAVTLLMQSLM